MRGDITASEQFTEQQVRGIRGDLVSVLKDRNYAIVVGGSYARLEASTQSDLDYFLICDSASTNTSKDDLPLIKERIQKFVKKEFAADGVFGHSENIEEMIQNIGGNDDTNEKITRRILFLLEGDWLYDENRFASYRD